MYYVLSVVESIETTIIFIVPMQNDVMYIIIIVLEDSKGAIHTHKCVHILKPGIMRRDAYDGSETSINHTLVCTCCQVVTYITVVSRVYKRP